MKTGNLSNNVQTVLADVFGINMNAVYTDESITTLEALSPLILPGSIYPGVNMSITHKNVEYRGHRLEFFLKKSINALPAGIG